MARRPGRMRVKQALNDLRINQGITTAMMPSLTFSPTIGITTARIDKLGIDIRSFHEPLKRSVQKVIAPSFRKNFDVGGRPRWENYAEPTTAEIQPRLHGGTHSLLIKSGRMRRTISQLNVWNITRTSALLNNVPDKIWYANLHQAGYEGKGAKRKTTSARELRQRGATGRSIFKVGSTSAKRVPPIPARPFVMLQPEDIKDIHKVFDEWLGERIAKRWG
jgi:phage gpG-like protein